MLRYLPLLLLVGGCLPRIISVPPLDGMVDERSETSDSSPDTASDTLADSSVDQFDTRENDVLALDAEASVEDIIVPDTPPDSPPRDTGPLPTFTAISRVCATVGSTTYVPVTVSFSPGDSAVTLSLDGLSAGVSFRPTVVNAPSTTPHFVELFLSSAPTAPGTTVTVQLVATNAGGRSTQNLTVQLDRCPGMLDRSFNTLGSGFGPGSLSLPTPRMLLGPFSGEARRLHLASNGVFYAAGAVYPSGNAWWGSNTGNSSDIAVWAVSSEGSPLTTFASGGLFTRNLSSETVSAPNFPKDIVWGVDSDDRGVLLLAMASGNMGSHFEGSSLVRLRNNGTLDSSFGDPIAGSTDRTGILRLPRLTSSNAEFPNRMLRSSDGTRWAAATIGAYGAVPSQGMFFHFDTMGAPIPFGMSNAFRLPITNYVFSDIFMDGTNPVAIGVYQNKVLMVRLRPEMDQWVVDTGFSMSGALLVDVAQMLGNSSIAVAVTAATVDREGRYLVTGYRQVGDGLLVEPFVLRLNAVGDLVPFSAASTFLLPRCSAQSPYGYVKAIAVNARNQIILGGQCIMNPRGTLDYAFISAYSADGRPIENFGDGAVPGVFRWLQGTSLTTNNGHAEILDIAIDPMNRIAATGIRYDSGASVPFILRLLGPSE